MSSMLHQPHTRVTERACAGAVWTSTTASVKRLLYYYGLMLSGLNKETLSDTFSTLQIPDGHLADQSFVDPELGIGRLLCRKYDGGGCDN